MSEIKNIVRFELEDRSKFGYWFAHYCAYNMTALNLKHWRFKYLFHDIEKPWLRLFFKYKTVQHIHRNFSSHHLEHYFYFNNFDAEGVIIDWECSRFTKKSSPLNAAMLYKVEFEQLYNYLVNGNTDCGSSTVQYIAETPDLYNDRPYLVFKIASMYNKLHAAFLKLGIEHEYDDMYVDKLIYNGTK